MSKLIKKYKCHDGELIVNSHKSKATACPMTYAAYIPPAAASKEVSCIIYLSGLTCTWENAATKSGIQMHAKQNELAVIFPDTSPRGEDVPDENEYFLGQGAGYYLNATKEPYSKNFNMEDYITIDLLAEIKSLPINLKKIAIMGHSMGGHGAITLGLNHADKFSSISALSPILSLTNSPWGKKAISTYMKEPADDKSHLKYDACHLMKNAPENKVILIDQGGDDEFLKEQLMPNLLSSVHESTQAIINYREHPGYDHSYYFIQSLIGDHVNFHSANLA